MKRSAERTARFDFHGLFEFTVATDRTGYVPFFQNEYRLVPTRPRAGPTRTGLRVRLNIFRNIPSPGGEVAIKRTRRYKNLFTLEYVIEGLDTNSVTISMTAHPIDRVYTKATAVFAQSQLLEPLLYYKLLEHDVFFMHASGIADGARAYLFPAHGGTGKTTLSLNLCRRGYDLLGDDLLFVVAGDQKVYPYPKPLHLFSYNIDSLRGARITRIVKLKVKAKDAIRWVLQRLLRTELLISTRVNIDDAYPRVSIADPVRYEQVVFLTRDGSGGEFSLDDEADIERACDAITQAGDLRETLFNFILDPDRAAQFVARERASVRKILEPLERVLLFDVSREDGDQSRALERLLS